MKYLFTIACMSLSFALFGDEKEDYQIIRDNAKDCHEEYELGEFDYPDLVLKYKECRDASLLIMDQMQVDNFNLAKNKDDSDV